MPVKSVQERRQLIRFHLVRMRRLQGDPCSGNGWYGVGCQGGHVASLTLIDNAMSGTLPSDFGNLQYLQTVNLDQNSIGGT